MLRKLLVLSGLLLSNALVAGAAVHVNINAIGGTAQTVIVRQQLPQRFVARATFDDGTPVAGLDLQFGVNFCMPVPGTASACPNAAAYGHFVGNAGATTDASGTAISAPFVAGTAQGSYSLFVSRANWTQLINGQTLTDIPVAPTVSNLYQVVQAPAPVTAPTPALSPSALIALIALLGVVAYRRLNASA